MKRWHSRSRRSIVLTALSSFRHLAENMVPTSNCGSSVLADVPPEDQDS